MRVIGSRRILHEFPPLFLLSRTQRRYISKTRSLLEAQPSPSSKSQQSSGPDPFLSRLRTRLKQTPIQWTALPFGLGVAVLVTLNFLKQQGRPGADDRSEPAVKLQGPWQVHVIGALPLKTLSRIYGRFNEYTLPLWFRVPGFKFYGWIFGVNFDEVEKPLADYSSLSDFFLRGLKAGSRHVDEAQLISPADGTVVNFGYIENHRVENVKGKSYSVDALLAGTGPRSTDAIIDNSIPRTSPNRALAKSHSIVNEEEFANINDINYTLDKLIGDDQHDGAAQGKDATKADAAGSHLDHAAVALDVGPKMPSWTIRGIPRPGNKMFFAVVYLGPGDYHRFHSPTAWVVEKRRHFVGELFSVSPYIVNKLADLFVLNERVALLGRWRHGFFSMTPVGATNVGRIIINFDEELHTNSVTPVSERRQGKFSEANYASASRLLQGQALRPFDEMGGFQLGSTIVLIFEAPEDFQFKVRQGQKIQVGQTLGN